MDGWWNEIDNDVRSCLERFGPMSPRDLARQLKLSEGAVSSVLSMLAQEGKLRISARRAASRRRQPTALALIPVHRRTARGTPRGTIRESWYTRGR